MQSIALIKIGSLDTPVSDEVIDHYVKQIGFMDENVVAQVQERILGERSNEFYLGLKQAKANSVLSQIEQGGVARTLGIAALGR